MKRCSAPVAVAETVVNPTDAVQLFMGIGVALFFMPTLSILMSDLPPSQIVDGAGPGDVPAHVGR